jgi:hypothetical protein
LFVIDNDDGAMMINEEEIDVSSSSSSSSIEMDNLVIIIPSRVLKQSTSIGTANLAGSREVIVTVS